MSGGWSRTLAAGMLAGLAAGALVGGVGGRLAMRVATEMGGFENTSIGGTFGFIVAMGVVGAVAGAVLAVVTRLWAVHWAGIAVATTLLVFAAIRIEGEWPALVNAGNPMVNVVAFAAIGFGYGVLWHTLAVRWGRTAS